MINLKFLIYFIGERCLTNAFLNRKVFLKVSKIFSLVTDDQHLRCLPINC